MKTIGLLGGMSWESTLEYYRLLNESIKNKLKGSHSAKCLMYSFDYFDLESLLNRDNWKEITAQLVEQGKNLKKAGADFILICANTMHIVADDVEKEVGLEVLHIAKTTKIEIMKHKIKKVGLLGTKFTMESDMYPKIMKIDNIEIIVPSADEQALIHQVIYNELILGIFSNESKKKFLDIISRLESKGAEGVILGCTEIPLLIKQSDVNIPIFNTMEIHAIMAVEKALKYGNN